MRPSLRTAAGSTSSSGPAVVGSICGRLPWRAARCRPDPGGELSLKESQRWTGSSGRPLSRNHRVRVAIRIAGGLGNDVAGAEQLNQALGLPTGSPQVTPYPYAPRPPEIGGKRSARTVTDQRRDAVCPKHGGYLLETGAPLTFSSTRPAKAHARHARRTALTQRNGARGWSWCWSRHAGSRSGWLSS